MNLKNCKVCGKVYDYDGNPICPACRKKDEEDFEKVKLFLEDNPAASMKEIEEATEVNSTKIMRFLRDGRLEFIKIENSLLKCEGCGKPIKAGRYCSDCLKKMNSGFGIVNKTDDSRPLPSSNLSGKMHWGGNR